MSRPVERTELHALWAGAVVVAAIAALAGPRLIPRPARPPTRASGIIVVPGGPQATRARASSPSILSAAIEQTAPEDPGVWATPAEWAQPEVVN